MANFWFKFEWAAWLGDRDLARCTFETQGFWIRCIALMEESGTWCVEGTIEQIANLLGCSEKIAKRCIEDLEDNSAAEIRHENVQKNGRKRENVKVVSRRILKRLNLREYNKLAKQKERRNKNVKAVSRPLSKDKSLRVLEESTNVDSKEREKASPKAPLAVAPKRNTHPSSHPAVLAVKVHMKNGPDPANFIDIIQAIGPKPDYGKLSDCYREWVKRGFKPENLAWALEWYPNGIPANERGKINGSHKQPVKSNVIAIEQSAEYFERKYGSGS